MAMGAEDAAATHWRLRNDMQPCCRRNCLRRAAMMALHQAMRLHSPDKSFSSSNKRGSEVLTVEPAMQTKASKAMLQPREVLKVLHVGCCTIKSCLQAANFLFSRRLLPRTTAVPEHAGFAYVWHTETILQKALQDC